MSSGNRFIFKKLFMPSFCRNFLITIVFLACFLLPVSAREQIEVPGIPDFIIHRISPTAAVITSEMPKIKEMTTSEIKPPEIIKTPEIEKNETIKVTKTATTTKPIKAQKENKESKLQKSETLKKQEIKTVIAPRPKKIAELPNIKTVDTVQKNVKTTEAETSRKITEKTSKEKTDNEMVSKINKIIENESLPANITSEQPEKKRGNIYFKTLSSLSIVLFLILTAAWIYAKLKGLNPAAVLTGNFAEKDLNNFNVLTSSSLGQGKNIHLVEINGKQLVVGSTSSNVNLLTEISSEDIRKFKENKQKVKTPEENDTTSEQPESEQPVPEFDNSDETYSAVFKEALSAESEDLPEEISENADYYSLTHTDVYKDYINNKEESEDT